MMLAPGTDEKFSYKSVMQIPSLRRPVINGRRRRSKGQCKGYRRYRFRPSYQITGRQRPAWSARLKKRSPTSSSERRTSAQRSPFFAAKKMYEFVDRLFGGLFPRVRDPRNQRQLPSTAEEMTPWDSRSSLIFPRNRVWTRSTRYAVGTSALSPPPLPTKKPASC